MRLARRKKEFLQRRFYLNVLGVQNTLHHHLQQQRMRNLQHLHLVGPLTKDIQKRAAAATH